MARQASVARPAPTSTKGQRSPMTEADVKPGRVPSTGQRSLRVRALDLCYYNHMRRRTGDVFDLLKAEDFNARVMEYVDARQPTKVTGAQQALDIAAGQEAVAARGRQRAGIKVPDPIGAADDDE